MRQTKWAILVFFSFGALFLLSLAAQQTAQSFSQKEIVHLNYLLYVPKIHTVDSLPLILFLHGSGESGDDLQLVKKNGLPAIIENKTDFPAIVVSPQCPDAEQGWECKALKLLLDKVIATHPVDRKRIYITGLSMGGQGTWDMIIHYPNFFACAVPVCGWGDRFLVENVKELPIWAFHGAQDRVVPCINQVELIDKLQSLGNKNVKLTIYPDANHNSWTETYNNPALYDWMFSQKRK